MQVELVSDVLRQESLSLFAQFFQNYTYWQDSLIAEYTLTQYQQLIEGTDRNPQT